MNEPEINFRIKVTPSRPLQRFESKAIDLTKKSQRTRKSGERRRGSKRR